MEERSGVISEEELKLYDGADIILLQNSNERTGSDLSGELSGAGSYIWRIAWDQDGFSGQNWEAFNGIDLVQRYGTVDAVISKIEANPVTYAVSVATTNIDAFDAGCASAEPA